LSESLCSDGQRVLGEDIGRIYVRCLEPLSRAYVTICALTKHVKYLWFFPPLELDVVDSVYTLLGYEFRVFVLSLFS